MAKYPGWRTMTAAQRYNARYDKIWDDAKRRDPKLFGGRSNLPGQLELPDTGEDMAGLAKQKAAAPLRPSTDQKLCDVGLFSDDAAQLDLVDRLGK